MKDDRLYLIHMTECMARIEQYTREGREAFMASTLIQDAVVRNLQTLAESSRRISDAVKAKHPDVDWRALHGFRNVVVHDYLNVDLARIWQIVEEGLPDLRQKLMAILEAAK